MSVSDKKIAVLLAQGFQDQELEEPVAALKADGADIVLIGLNEADRQGVEGKHGTVESADITIDEVRPEDFDLLLIPGGKGPEHLRKDERVLQFVRAFDRDAKPIAAICHGPQVLVTANVLRGRTATSFSRVVPELIAAGAKYVDEEVVVEGNLITSRKVEDIPAFIEAIRNYFDREEKQVA